MHEPLCIALSVSAYSEPVALNARNVLETCFVVKDFFRVIGANVRIFFM